jgi:hypothetical protein
MPTFVVSNRLQHEPGDTGGVAAPRFDLNGIEIKRGFALRSSNVGLKELVRAGLCHLSEIARHRLQPLMLARREDRCEFRLVDAVLVDLLVMQSHGTN